MGCETVRCVWCGQAIRHYYCPGKDSMVVEACKHCDPGNPDIHERRVRIYQDPTTRKELEGEAEIVQVIDFEGGGVYEGSKFIYAMVRFGDSIGKYMRSFSKEDLIPREE